MTDNPNQSSSSRYILAVDVSHWQGKIDWERLAAMGIEHVWVKSSEGDDYEDPYFKEYKKGIISVGLTYDPYHYYIPAKSPIKQIEFFLRVTNGECDSGMVVDLEHREHIPASYRNDAMIALSTLEKLSGYQPVIYTGSSYWMTYFPYSTWALNYRLWIAHYTRRAGPDVPPPWHPLQWFAWQFTDRLDGRAYGVESKQLDGDLIQGRIERLKSRY